MENETNKCGMSSEYSQYSKKCHKTKDMVEVYQQSGEYGIYHVNFAVILANNTIWIVYSMDNNYANI